MQITRGKILDPQKVIIYGPAGIGKSTMAAQFPGALFSDTEGSTKHMDVPRLPKPTSWQMLLSQAAWLKANPTACNTYVIDTADWAERLCIASICAEKGWNGIEDAGWGKGYTYLEEEFGRYLNLLNDLIDEGINIVFVAHAQMRKFEQPNETGAYDRWELKLEKKTAPLLKEWADMVLFCNYKIYVINIDNKGAAKGKNKAQGGKRVIYTSHHPCWDAKNRHNLPEEIEMDYSAIAHCIPQRTAAAVAAAPKPELKPEIKPEPQPQPELKQEQQALPTVEPPTPQPQSDNLEAEGVPKPLADLMRAEGVSLSEIQSVIVAKGHFPAGTPFRNYPTDYVQGVLIAAWPQVLAAIKEQRDEVPF